MQLFQVLFTLLEKAQLYYRKYFRQTTGLCLCALSMIYLSSCAADSSDPSSFANSLAQFTQKDAGINENVNAATIYGEKGVVLYDPLGEGSDFVLDPSGRIVKSDVDAAEAGVEINDLERRFFRSNKHLIDSQNLFYSGLYEESLNEVQASIELTPRSAQAYALKGSIEYKLGNIERAKAAWMVALKLDPSKKSVARVLYLIGNETDATANLSDNSSPSDN